MEEYKILLREGEGGQPSQEEIEKYRHERERESEGGRKGGKIGGKRSHGGERKSGS